MGALFSVSAHVLKKHDFEYQQTKNAWFNFLEILP